MGIGLNRVAGRIQQSEIRIMSVECEKRGGINLAQGVCDTPVPAVVRDAAAQAIRDGANSYVRLDGIAPLREAIARKLRGWNGIAADPAREVLVTNGATGAFYAACQALLEPGDEFILFEPYYGYHLNTLAALGVTPVYVRLEPPDWGFTREQLAAAITPRTRGIMINTPANPSGKVFTREELEVVAALAVKHDLFVFTDEIYEYFLYDGRKHVSPATLPGMGERTVTISGFSKTFSITGWRLGYLTCDARWAPAIAYFHDLAYVCAPSPFQHAVTAGLNGLHEDFYEQLGRDYARKRDLICGALTQAGLAPHVPQGSYYVLADASSLPGPTSKDRAMQLLEMTGVASVPGASFYHDGAGDSLLRFCFAKTDADLEAACTRLERLRTGAVR